MITNTTSRNVVSTVAGGDTRQFGMDLDGKAFRILFDGIYSNKIGTPIREYLANGYDSHVVAGCPDRPVRVGLPTSLEPTFTIRDFGVGLSHDDVMDLYCNMFRSSKSKSNDEVGAFGLGSKSAFAYTDSFVVTSFHGGRKRVYHAVIGSDDIPTMSELVELAEDCDETGFEVAIPVKAQDVARFVDEYRKVAEGFDVKPICNMDICFPEPIVSGDSWKIYSDSSWNNSLAVRQGCVVYPVSLHDFGATSALMNDMRYGRMVVDVPIGSAEVAVSREALAFDARTIENIREAFTVAFAEALQLMKDRVSDAPSFIEAMRERRKLNSLFLRAGEGMKWRDRPLYDELRFPTMEFAHIGSRGSLEKWKSASFDLDDAKNRKYVVDRGQTIVRRRMRLNDFKGTYGQSRVIVIEQPTNKQLSSFIRLLQIPAENIISLDALPDPGPPIRDNNGNGGRSKPTGVYNSRCIKLDDPPDEVDVWLPLTRGNSTSEHYLFGSHNPKNGLGWQKLLASNLGLDETIYMLTPAAEKRYGVTVATRFDHLLNDLVVENEQEILDGYYDALLQSRCSGMAARYNILAETDSFRGGNRSVGTLLIGNYGYSVEKTFLTNKIGYAKVEEVREAVNARVATLAETFPLLFDMEDPEAMTEYINSRKKNLK